MVELASIASDLRQVGRILPQGPDARLELAFENDECPLQTLVEVDPLDGCAVEVAIILHGGDDLCDSFHGLPYFSQQAVERPTGRKPFDAVEAPFFSPDGALLTFSAKGLGPVQSLSPLDQLLAVQPVLADGAPSDWWRIPVTRGQPKRLTSVYQSGLYGNNAPDGKHVDFVTESGMFVMNLDGTGLVKVLDSAASGTVPSLGWGSGRLLSAGDRGEPEAASNRRPARQFR